MNEINKIGERDFLFDNIKAVMLFLVALGHTLEVYKSSGGLELNLMKYIYLFHMPVFAFVTGYWTKNTEKARATAVEKILIPYIIFQGAYIISANLLMKAGIATFNSSIFNGSLVLPSSAFYYLLAVFFWKILSPDILKLRYPLLTAFALGLLISITGQTDFHRGLGAVFSLLIFFVMGLLCDKKTISRIRKIPHWVSVCILLVSILPAVYLPYAIHSIRMTYASVGFSITEGFLYRSVFYLTASVMGMAIINLMPQRELFISRIGKASILVYAISTFAAPHAYILIAGFLLPVQCRTVNLICMVIFCFILVYVASASVFHRIYQYIINGVMRLIFKVRI